MKKFNIDQQFYVQLTHLGMQVLMAHYSPEEMEDLLNQRQVKFHSEYWYRFTLSQFCLVFFSFTPSEYIGENIIFDEMDLSDANPQ